jgi:hypothetical protein
MKVGLGIFLCTLIFAALMVVGVGNAVAQAPATPESRARQFYSWYLHELNAERNPISNSRGLRKYVTTRMVRSIERALGRENGIDADIFIDAQDFDEQWEQNITASKAVINGGTARVTITLRGPSSSWNRRLRLGLKKEAGEWKIDSVNGRMSP